MRRAHTGGSDGAHFRSGGGSSGPAAAAVTAALHLGEGLRQLIATAPIAQRGEAESRAHVCQEKEMHG